MDPLLNRILEGQQLAFIVVVLPHLSVKVLFNNARGSLPLIIMPVTSQLVFPLFKETVAPLKNSLHILQSAMVMAFVPVSLLFA